jgi:D-alanyl-lipoteichoic acid acyltransferase DltB (MBOAT superfamily)
MLFTEARFFLWLAFALAIYWSAPATARARVLLVLSLVFWIVSSLEGSAYLALAMLITWVGGRGIVDCPTDSSTRKYWLWGSVGSLVGMLAMAKFAPNLASGLMPGVAGGHPASGLPMGISYFTFHCLGYLLDVHWTKEKTMTANTLGLYLTFFPKAVMGPIERSGVFQRQTESLPTARWSYEEVGPACFQICVGLFMKFVLADRIKLFVDGYYNLQTTSPNVPGVIAAVMFCWQLYYDFFGYSLIAVGVGRLFGFKLPNNFNRPFFVTSISDFWSRWHISLSSWFQEYFYNPLRFQLRRRRKFALIAAGMISFLAIGIWHGTGWTFVVLGLVHGLLVTTEALYPKLRQAPSSSLVTGLRIVLTFLIVAATLVLFRAPSLSTAGAVYAKFFSWDSGTARAIMDLLPKFDWLLVAILAGLTEILTWKGAIAGGGIDCGWVARLAPWRRTWIFAIILALTWSLGMFGKTTFLYNQF